MALWRIKPRASLDNSQVGCIRQTLETVKVSSAAKTHSHTRSEYAHSTHPGVRLVRELSRAKPVSRWGLDAVGVIVADDGGGGVLP